MKHVWKTFLLFVLVMHPMMGMGAPVELSSIIDRVIEEGCNKELVLLGELPSHGEAKTFETKAQIVEQLVTECGFSSLLFEGSFHEFEEIRKLTSSSADTLSALDNAIGGFWTTRELTDWRVWLWDEVVDGRIRLGGIDDQPSATTLLTRRTLPVLIANSSPSSEALVCQTTVGRHLSWDYSPQDPLDAAEVGRLATCVDAANTKLKARNRSDVGAASVAAFHRYVARQIGRADAPTRDESMFQAFKWHRDALPSDSRIIIWTSNGHAARMSGGRTYIPLGDWLGSVYGDRMLAIAFTAAAGMSSRAGGRPQPLEPAPPDSLEWLALQSGSESTYLGAEELVRMEGKASRIYGGFSVHPWWKHFDGVIVFNVEVAPTFFPAGETQ